MGQENNRLLMELERSMRSINRETMNPVIHELTIQGLEPVLRLVARARARYLKALVDLGDLNPEDGLDEGQLVRLEQLRREYDELSSAARALETAIQRGYLDVEPNPR